MRSVIFALSLACTAGSIACSASEPDPELTTQCDGDYLLYEPGLVVPTDEGSFDLTFVAATPEPPDEGDNDWVLQVSDAAGDPVEADVVVTPWMPAHGHGVSPPDYFSRSTGVDGEVAIDTFDLIMPGTWEFRILVTAAGTDDTAAPSFCIEG
jgi:hypothetical protein